MFFSSDNIILGIYVLILIIVVVCSFFVIPSPILLPCKANEKKELLFSAEDLESRDLTIDNVIDVSKELNTKLEKYILDEFRELLIAGNVVEVSNSITKSTDESLTIKYTVTNVDFDKFMTSDALNNLRRALTKLYISVFENVEEVKVTFEQGSVIIRVVLMFSNDVRPAFTPQTLPRPSSPEPSPESMSSSNVPPSPSSPTNPLAT